MTTSLAPSAVLSSLLLDVPLDLLVRATGALVIVSDELPSMYLGFSFVLNDDRPVVYLPAGLSAEGGYALTRMLLSRALGLPEPESIAPFRFNEPAAA